MSNFFDSSDILKQLFEWRKRLIIVAVIAGAVSAGVSLIITERFKAEAVIYPSNLSSYSVEAPTEQLLQFLHSEELIDQLIKSFDLGEHYEIDLNKKNARTEIKGLLKESLNIKKTEYESISMSCIDTDPQMASRILDSLLIFVHDKIQDIHIIQLNKSINSVKKEMNIKKSELDSVNRKLVYYRDEYGIINYDVQTEQIYTVYYAIKGDSKVKPKEVAKVEKMLNDIRVHGGAQNEYSTFAVAAMEDYVGLKRHYEKLMETSRFEKVYVNIVSAPQTPEKRHSPLRMLIVLFSTITSLFLAIVVSYMMENDN
ncbi:MAG: hypothetical protein HRT71_12865 [Flavobacteriales bacterium]|nr:hypothetical protein [Flavobacteriales bacterium]